MSYAVPTLPELPGDNALHALLHSERQALAAVVEGRPLPDVLGRICRALEERSPGLVASVQLLGDDGLLRVVAAPRLPAALGRALDGLAPQLRGNGHCAACAFTGQAVYVPDLARDPLWSDALRTTALAHGVRGGWALPLRGADGRLLGTLANDFDVPRHPSAGEIDAMSFLARTAALVVERHRMDELLRESEDHLRHTVALSPQVPWSTTPDGLCDRVGEGWRTWTGRDGTGSDWLECIHPEDRERAQRAWQQAVATGDPYDTEYRIRHRDGSWRWLHARALPRRDAAGAIVRWYGSSEDIHDRKLDREALQEREAQLKRLNATLEESVRSRTNELTELTRHLQTVQEALRDRLARELHDDLGAIFTTAQMDAARLKARIARDQPETAERLQHLIHTLDAGVAIKRRIIEELRPSALSNLGLVHALQILAGDCARATGLDIGCELEEMALPPAAQLTAYRLVQEALANAARWSGARHVVVELQAHGDQHACVSVTDDGIGFDTKRRSLSAHGLLSLRYRVEAEGGTMQIESAPRAGTRIAARLPRLERAEPGLPAEVSSRLMGL